MSEDERERLPPPPFWRTAYFERTFPDRSGRGMISSSDIVAVMRAPYRRLAQENGRLSLWRKLAHHSQFLRVVVLSDGVTVHNAYLDRSFKP